MDRVQGQVKVDFHALRHTYITRLARAGLSPKLAKELARHSTITLTMDRYVHIEQDELHEAIARVPSLPSRMLLGDAERVSKTDSPRPPAHNAYPEDGQQNWQYSADAVGLFLSGLGTDDEALELMLLLRKAFAEMELDASSHDESSTGTNGPAWIRTRDRAIMSRLL